MVKNDRDILLVAMAALAGRIQRAADASWSAADLATMADALDRLHVRYIAAVERASLDAAIEDVVRAAP